MFTHTLGNYKHFPLVSEWVIKFNGLSPYFPLGLCQKIFLHALKFEI